MKKRFSVAILLFNTLLFTESGTSSEGKQFSSLRAYCPWGPARRYNSRRKCIAQCGKFKGFIIPDSDQLVCFHVSKVASLISLLDKETNSKQCGEKTSNKTDTGRACNPKITCENETDDQCSEKCSKYTVYITKSDYKHIAHCGETYVIEPIIRTLDATGNPLNILLGDGTQKNLYTCSCGIGEEGKEVKEPIRSRQSRLKPNPTDETLTPCPNISLKYNRADCSRSCGNLNGIYSREDNQLLCFHVQKDVTALRATAEYCECRVRTFRYSDKLPIIDECPQKRRIQLNNEVEIRDCPRKCNNYKAYVYYPRELDTKFTVYCELPSYIFENLSYEMGNMVVVESAAGNKKYRKFECKCGIRLSQSEINSIISTFSIINNDERDEVRNNLQISNHSDIRSDETQISDSQSFAKLHIIHDEEIDNLINDTNFIRDFIQDEENLIHNINSNDSDIPVVGKKRTSREMNDENDRGKNFIQINNEMVASCPKILLKISKEQCRKGCANLNGIYSRDNEFICFHNSERDVTGFQATAEYCECWIADNYEGEFLLTQKCPTERRIRLNNEAEAFDCPRKCANYKAYLFSPNRFDPKMVYCEFPSYIFKNLSYEIGNTKDVRSTGNRIYRKYECKCGLILSQSEINLKIKTFSTNGGRINEVENNSQIQNYSYNTRRNGKEISDSQLFARMDQLQNDEIDDSITNSDFLFNLIHGGENAINNNSNDFDVPIVRNKRASRQVTLGDVVEAVRSKKRCDKFTIPGIDETVQPADLESPLMSFHRTALPNNNTQIAGSSSLDIPRFVDLDFIESDEDMCQNMFAGVFHSYARFRHGMPIQNNAANNNEERLSFPNNIGLSGNTLQNMELSRNTSYNTGVGPNLIQNWRFICDDTSESMGVNNLTTMRSINHDDGPTKPISATISNEDIISRKSLCKSPSFLFPNATMAINELIRPDEGFDSPSMFGHQMPLQNMFNDGRESLSCLQNMGFSGDTSQTMEPLNQNIMMGSNSDKVSRVNPPETEHPSHWGEKNKSRGSFPDATSLIFPNVTMEINDVI